MAFALTGYIARQIDIASPSYKRGIQQIVLQATGTANDVDLDIGDDGGTFWTDALADTAYGDIAATALANLQTAAGQAECLLAVKSPQLLDRVQVASLTTTGQYTLAIDTIGPNIAFNAADGETAYYIVLEFEMNNSVAPVTANINQ